MRGVSGKREELIEQEDGILSWERDREIVCVCVCVCV